MDELIRKAFEEYHQQLDDAIDQAEVEKMTLSPETEEKIERLIKKMERFYYSFVNTAAKRVACVLAAMLLATTVATFSVEALREGFLHFVVEVFDGKGSVELPGEPSDQAPKRLSRIPNGFTLVSKTENEQTMICLYEGADHQNFQFSYHPKGTNITVYTENTDYRTVTVGKKHEGILFENYGERFLIFNDGHHMYAIIGTLSEEETLALADTLFETR